MRRIVRFESPDGSLVLDLPMWRAEQEEGQVARFALLRPPLLNYASDLQGSATVVTDVAEIRHRAVLVDPDGADIDLDRIRSFLRRIGRGRLWMQLNDSTERWCWARAGELGGYKVSYERPLETVISITFQRLSDWYSAGLRSFSQIVTVSPTTIALDSQGTVPTRQLEIEIEALAPSGFANPRLENVSTATSVTMSAASTATGQKLLLSLSANFSRRAQFWNGTSWQDVPVLLGPVQAELFIIYPGTQLVRVSGLTNALLTIRWYDAYV